MKGASIVAVLLVMSAGGCEGGSPSIPTGAGSGLPCWTIVGSMTGARQYHTATLLQDGRVLVAGGSSTDGSLLSSAELYDPTSKTWTQTGSLTAGRWGHTATLLSDGTVLVTGAAASAELYDPTTGTWTQTAPPTWTRQRHTATLLAGGTVLIAGGIGPMLLSAERYDPRTNSWTETNAPMTLPRDHTATLLPDGTVLVVGGTGGGDEPEALSSADLYDDTTRSWSPTTPLATERGRHTATLLADGTLLVAGGDALAYKDRAGLFTHYLPTTELYAPSTKGWSPSGSLTFARERHTATLLGDGTVLVTGGRGAAADGGDVILASAELYNPATKTWTTTAPLTTARIGHTATLLANGTVLVAGGNDTSAGLLASAELYSP